MGCQPDCLSSDFCDVKLPIPGHDFGPYVRLFLGDEITVGNHSLGDNNHAIIKSMEYGMSDGVGLQIEIFDEKGSDFEIALEKLNKKISEVPQDYKMRLEFGWIKNFCDGSVSIYKNPTNPLLFYPQNLKASYEGGKVKYTITGTDFIKPIAENRVERNQGREGQEKKLKQAIRDLFKDNDPKVQSIKYLRKNASIDGEPWCFRPEDGGCEGPASKWTADQQDALAVARKWITPLTTDHCKGIVLCWNNNVPGGEIIFWEVDRIENCSKNLGTYIVNGGKCSPVLSFTPNAEYPGALKAKSGGTAGGPTSAITVKAKEPICDQQAQDEKAGVAEYFPPEENALRWRPPNEIVPKMQEATAAHDIACKGLEAKWNVEAELKIYGEPRFDHPLSVFMSEIGIIVINPFYIEPGGGGGACGDWLASPVCNPIWTSPHWMVKGVNHQIREGSFVTIIKCALIRQEREEP